MPALYTRIPFNITLLIKRTVQYLLLLILPLILFHSAIEAILDVSVVKYLYRGFCPSLIKDICVFGAALLIIWYYFSRPTKYVSSVQRATLVIVTGLTYLCYRFFWHHWQFYPFELTSKLKYADVILLITFGEIFLLLRSFKKAPLNLLSESAFYGNQPILNSDEDKLGYVKYAETIAEKLNSSRFSEAFAIGVNGTWGSGKTSLLNLVKNKLIKTDRIIIDFKPWNAHDPQAILKDFFETVQGAIAPYQATLASEIRDYGKKLVDLHVDSLSQSLSGVFDILTGYNSSLSKQYEQINEGLKRADRQLVIFIDDLDRLDTKEINEVIRLIRNTANFYNTVFLAAYDREYLLEAIKQINEHNYRHFLEKIFQLEINLPGFGTYILKNYLRDELKKAFGAGHEQECNEAVEDLYNFKVNILGDWVSSIRDIHHILNSLVVNAVQIKEEILIKDMLKLELLRYRYPMVYHDLFYKANDWLDADNTGQFNRDPSYTLKKDGHGEMVNSSLRDEKSQYQLKGYEADQILKLLRILFKPAFLRTGQEYLALRYPVNFSKYFQYSLKESQLSNKDFYEARQAGLPIFQEKIIEWLHQGMAVQLHRVFERLDDITNQDDFENIVRATIFMSNTKLDKTNAPFSYIPFKIEKFADLLDDRRHKISHKIYHDANGGEGKFKNFVRSVFDAAEYPYNYEADVLKYLKNDDVLPWSPLTLAEIDSYLLQYFERFLEKRQNFSYDDFRFLELLRTGAQIAYEGSQMTAWVYPSKALLMMKAHIAKYLDSFLYWMISPELMRDEHAYTVSDVVFQLFLTKDVLMGFLETHKGGSEYLTEFLEFFEAWEKAQKGYIKYSFQTIPVKNREVY